VYVLSVGGAVRLSPSDNVSMSLRLVGEGLTDKVLCFRPEPISAKLYLGPIGERGTSKDDVVLAVAQSCRLE